MGSITHIVNDKKILNQYEYDVWGNVVNQKETIKNRFKFNGQQLDPITQQYYLRARFYNPIIGRFTQEDTYRGDGLNLYTYFENNPIYYVDPSGNVICEKRYEKLKQRLKDNKYLSQKQIQQMIEYEKLQNQNKNKNNDKSLSFSFKKSYIKKEQLPTTGKIRYIPPDDWKPRQPLPTAKKGDKKAFRDKFGNIWIKGPSRTKGQDFEWDVQLTKASGKNFKAFCRDGSHLNVSLDGKITHK